MTKFLKLQEDEIIFGSSDSAESQAIHQAVKRGKLRKLAPRIYSSNLTDAKEQIIRRNQYRILGKLFEGAILSHRTALEGGPTPEGLIVLTYHYTKKITLPGLTIRLLAGAPPQVGDTPFMEKLFIASRERALLENLQPSRGPFTKSLPRKTIEAQLDKICRIKGVEALQQLRDKARQLAPHLKLDNEFKMLDQMIGALLNTRSEYRLTSETAIARAAGKPFDAPRLELFATLATRLISSVLPSLPSTTHDEKAAHHLAFFEAYFSNYIEGTEFEVEEAADIIFHHKKILHRPEDAHDIVGTYQMVSDKSEMQKTPNSPDELITLLKRRHHFLMSVRQDKHPGEFKTLANRAGNTVFTPPELVRGTLEKAFSLYRSLEPGIKRAIFMMFLVAEVHPFNDGNGRIARIMMNAELSACHLCRIIIPTVYREDYLLALRRLSRSCDPEAYLTMLLRGQTFTASIDFFDYQQALEKLRKANAFMQPFEGKLIT